MKLVPLLDRVVLKPLKDEETTKSGIILPGNDKEKPGQGEVVAVGPGDTVDGKKIEMQVKKGDHVLYSLYSGNEIELDGEKFLVVRQSEIMAVIK